jgi:hypothetical protein
MNFLWLLIIACGTPTPQAPVNADQAKPAAAVENVEEAAEKSGCPNAGPDHDCDCGGAGAAAAAPADGEAAEKDDDGAAFACPMHPEVTATEAGSCTECGMDLTKG